MNLEIDKPLHGIPYLGNPFQTQTTQDAQVGAQAVCASTPVRICEPLCNIKRFMIEFAVISLGEVLLVF